MPSLYEVAVGLIVLGGMFALLNWLMVLQTLRTGRFHSGIALIGGVMMVGGMLMIPTLRPYAWVGVLADFGTLAFLWATPRICADVWATSRFNLLEEYAGVSTAKSVRIGLYRRGWFTMEQRFHRARGESGPVCLNFISTWRREENRLFVPMNEATAELEVTDDRPPALRVVVDFPNIPLPIRRTDGTAYEDCYSLAGIALMQQFRRS